MKNITILGVSGSIGSATLQIIDTHTDKFKVFAISANTNWKKMASLCTKYNPDYAVMVDANAATRLKDSINNDTEVLSGTDALCTIATHKKTDYVMAAIVGATGMSSTLAAAKAGKRIMLANKESLILAGNILIDAVKASTSELIPVDSEHSAIFQCLQSSKEGVSKIQLTASGGPFLHTPIKQLQKVTPYQACKHPNWDMGDKISVDSATMMNKGLEVIEAHYLFKLKPSQIDVVIHPQSIVHSCVYYNDSTVLSQLGNPDMRSAISYALGYPQHIASGVTMLDLTSCPPLEFYKPDLNKFTCLKLAFEALKKGENYIGAINAANEVAVAAFLKNKIKFLDISKIIETTLSNTKHNTTNSLDKIIENDKYARQVAFEAINML